MRHLRIFGLVAGTLALTGCMATRGAQDVACPRFSEYAEELPTSGFVADIQCEQDGTACGSGLEGLGEDSMSRAIRMSVLPGTESISAPGRNHLLLSGGGQWGAYGAGMFAELYARDQLNQLGVGLVTGVSTGGLQALLLTVALDPGQPSDRRAAAISQLTTRYSPTSEKQLVQRNSELLAVFTGSVAGTTPLRRQLFEVLCDQPGQCSLVQDLRRGRVETFIGFVEGRSGRFKYLSVKQVLDRETDDRAAASCIAAAALASAAMPVFHQQMRVTGGPEGSRTLFDGGVRQSVFLYGIGAKLEDAMKSYFSTSGATAPPRADQYPAIYVVRNGPTVRQVDDDVDEIKSAAPQGMRAYDLIVNELEVGSIASLRLANPYGPIWLTTADGWDKPHGSGEVCQKVPQDAMFSPPFMQCLQRLGADKAGRPQGPWWPLRPIAREGGNPP